MSKLPSVLLVEDSPSLTEIYKQYLSKENITLLIAPTGADAISAINTYQPELTLLDLKLPDMKGEEVLKHIKSKEKDSAVIVITAHGSVDIAVDLMRLGAQDFLQKPIEAARLLTTVRNCIENIKLKSLVADLNDDFKREEFQGFIGSSIPMQLVYKTIEAAANSKATIFITGESGTGKEVCAEAIHNQSSRRNEEFIALNCGAIPKDLMESEIFGHVKGAFTGAASERKGAASLANNGTLFLDEIGEMDLDLQTKLLRFIQSGVIKKVGGNKEEIINVRFICATNRDPLSQISEGKFREDLYYRLNVVPIHLPALRDREEDIVLLANHFLNLYSKEDNKDFTRLSNDVINLFMDYNWPGNVRQLQNIIRNIVVLNNGQSVETCQLPHPFNSDNYITTPYPENQKTISFTPATSDNSENSNNIPKKEESLDNIQSHSIKNITKIRPLSEIEKETIEHAIEQCNGNIPKAAALLEVSPSTIYRKKQSWK